MKFSSACAGAAQSSSVFSCFGKGGTDQKDTEQILQHYKSRSVFGLHYFRKTFSTPFCIELTIASTYSTLLIESKSSMSWLTEPFDFLSLFLTLNVWNRLRCLQTRQVIEIEFIMNAYVFINI